MSFKLYAVNFELESTIFILSDYYYWHVRCHQNRKCYNTHASMLFNAKLI